MTSDKPKETAPHEPTEQPTSHKFYRMVTDLEKAPKQECPQCHSSASVVPIIYGLPIEIPEEVRSGNAVLGGCIGFEENLYCKKCELSFNAPLQ